MSEEIIDTSGINIVPSQLKKIKVFLGGKDTLSTSNFIERLAEVYEERSVILLDQPIKTPYFEGNVISYRDLDRLVQRAACMLKKLGVKKGDRVGLRSLNRIELAFVEFGAERVGAVPVPLNFMLTTDEVAELVGRCGAKVMVVDRGVYANNIKDIKNMPGVEQWLMVTAKDIPEGFQSFDKLMTEAEESAESVEVADDDPAIIFFTAGTTGMPKGAVLTSGGMLHAFRKYTVLSSFMPTPTGRLALLVMPLAHTGGHQNLLLNLAMATPALMMGRFDPTRILDLIEQYKVSWFAGIPTMFRMLVAAGAADRDLSSIRLWGGGGDAFPAELIQQMRDLTARKVGPFTTKAVFVTGYGLAETAGQVSLSPPFAAGDNCVGWFMPGVQWRLVDEQGHDVHEGQVGELLLQTGGLMRDYYNMPEETAKAIQDGWFYTGDLMRRGDHGLFFFESRSKEMIKVGGYSVYPAEVEKSLEKHPQVEKAAVVGLPHPTKGELPCAGVVRVAGATITEDELMEWSRKEIAAYRCPRRIVFVDAIPLNFGMKPLRKDVRKDFLARGITVESRSDKQRKKLQVEA